MVSPNSYFLMGLEHECLTTTPHDPESAAVAVAEFMEIFGTQAPSVGSVGAGIHNGYGRVYTDCGLHLEFASSECSSPYILPLIVERQQILAARAVAKLQEQGLRLVIANTVGTMSGGIAWSRRATPRVICR